MLLTLLPLRADLPQFGPPAVQLCKHCTPVSAFDAVDRMMQPVSAQLQLLRKHLPGQAMPDWKHVSRICEAASRQLSARSARRCQLAGGSMCGGVGQPTSLRI